MSHRRVNPSNLPRNAKKSPPNLP